MSTRLVLVDDHSLVLEGLKSLLSTEPGIEVVALCTDGREAVEAVAEHRPDVLVMDAVMPELDGTEALARMEELGIRVPTIVLSAALDDQRLMRCMELGVEGIVLKESAASTLIETINGVSRGERVIPEGVSKRALALLSRRKGEGEPDLTPREMQITVLVAGGASNKSVARSLAIAEGTVKLHLHRVYRKLGVANRVQLSLVARQRGWV